MTNTGIGRQEFGNDKSPAILECLKSLYGTQILKYLYQALLHLHDPMDRNQPVEVILRTTEEF